MTRPVDVPIASEVTNTHTRPFHLARLFFKDAIANVSEGPSVPYDGVNYIGDTLKVSNIVFSEKGFDSAILTLYDYGSSAISIVLNNQIAGRSCELFLAYADEDGNLVGAPVMIVKGVLEYKDMTEDMVVLDLLQKSKSAVFFPDQYVTKENGFNVLGKNGSVIYWGNDVYELTTE